jgi:putative hydrolase of the HAD superfamily
MQQPVVPSRVRAVLTDFGGVLTRRSPSAKEDFERHLGATLGDYRDAGMRIAGKLRLDPVEEVETGRLGEEEFLALLQEELPQADVHQLGAAYYAQHLTNPDMLAGIAEAHAAGIRTALLTNAATGWTPYWIAKVPDAQDVFDAIVVSASVGARKPDEAMFVAALQLLGGPEPGECVFLDDAEDNCESARRLGMHAILFTDTSSALEALAVQLTRHDVAQGVRS